MDLQKKLQLHLVKKGDRHPDLTQGSTDQNRSVGCPGGIFLDGTVIILKQWNLSCFEANNNMYNIILVISIAPL